MPTNQCRILFLAANPVGTERAELDEEYRAISKSVPNADGDALDLRTEWAVRPLELLEYLNDYEPQVVHFSGHGTPEEEIILVDDRGGPISVSAAALEQLFENFKDFVRVVVLNACYSAKQAEGIVKQVDCAIGMNQAIGDQAARTFAAAFYRAIASGRSVGNAFEQGKTAIMIMGIPEEATPEMLVRDGVDPDQMFLVARAAKSAEPAHAEPPPIETPPIESPPTNPVPVSMPPQQQPQQPPQQPLPPNPVPGQGATLADIVVGQWQVQIQTPYAIGQMNLQILPNGQFHGQLSTPAGISAVDGQWQVNVFTNQITLQGRQAMGPQFMPYAALVQVTYFDYQQVVGLTPASEQVMWQRLGA